MIIFQTLSGYVSAAKNKITSTVKSFWHNDYVQATCQGLAVPIYSYNSVRSLISSSQDVQTAVSRSRVLNTWYAFQALVLYVIYYRMVQPFLQRQQDQQDPASWNNTAISGMDWTFYLSMMGYLNYLWVKNTPQNRIYTATIAKCAGTAMQPSADFKPCDHSRIAVARADGDSMFFYLVNRYVVTKVSKIISNNIPGYYGKGIAFGLEAASFGWPLVEYKLSAVRQCTEDRYKTYFGNYAPYWIMFGASFVAATWSSSKILSTVSGKENSFIYDALFSYFYQRYILMSIAREKRFPGTEVTTPTIDIMAWINYFIETRPVKFLLGDCYSLEQLVQTQTVALWILAHEDIIKDVINYMRGGIQTVGGIQASRTVATLKWINHLIPYQLIPEQLKALGKSFSKTALNKLLRRIDELLDIARAAESKRSPQPNPLALEVKEDHFAVVRDEMKPIPNPAWEVVAEEKKPVTPLPIEFKPSLSEEKKAVVPLPIPITQALDRSLGPVPLSKNSAMLFAKKDDKKKQPVSRQQAAALALMTASVISKVGRVKVL